MIALRLALALILASPFTVAQGTTVVSGGGTALQQAIDNAVPGDTLDVLAGTYDSIRVGKGVGIRCRPGVTITPVAGLAPVRIVQLRAGETCELEGGRYASNAALVPALLVADCVGAVVLRSPLGATGSGFHPVFAVQRCTGLVLFDRVVAATVGSASTSFGSVENSDQVSFDACTIQGSVGVSRSNVAFVDTSLGQGLSVDGGNVTFAGGRIEGLWSFSGVGEPAVHLVTGELTLAGRADLIVRSWQPVPAIETSGGRLRLSPSVTLQSQPPQVTGPATVTRQHLPSIHPPALASGQPATFHLDGRPGATTATFVDVVRTPLATPLGLLWLAPTSPILDVRVLDATGAGTFTLPALVPAGAMLGFQPLSMSVTGAVLIGTPARSFVR